MKKLILKALIFLLIFNLFSFSQCTNVQAASKLSDIDSHWSKQYVQRLVDVNAISGYPDSTFRPDGTISRAAFITVLAKALELTPSKSNYFKDTEGHWAQEYISAAVDAGILNVDDYPSNNIYGNLVCYNFHPDVNITREDMAQIITRALGEEYSTYDITASSFKDNAGIDPNLVGYVAVASENGIISGFPDGTFSPSAYATRAQACVMITRLLDKLDEKPQLSEMDSEEIYDLYSKAVVTVEGINEDGTEENFGSGIIITKTGEVITNYHVIIGMKDLKVKFSDGTIKNVISVHNYDRSYDIAVLNLEVGTYNTVPLGNSRRLQEGEKIYTLGYPLALNLTISDGIISSKYNDYNGHNYIQISAPISHGSSGGALIDKYGRVVGITCAGFFGGQNMNLAIPICDVLNILVTEDKDIETNVATKSDVTLDNKPINGWIHDFRIFATNDLDMKEVVYDDVVNINDYDYLGYSIDIRHNPKILDNELFGVIEIKDNYGNLVNYEYITQRLYKGNKTVYNELIYYTSIKDLGPGNFTVYFYLGEELVASDYIVIKSNVSYDSFDPESTAIKVFDYDTYKLSENKTINYTNIFKSQSTSSIGFEIKAYFNKSSESEESIVYDIIIEDSNGNSKKYSATGILHKNQTMLGFYSSYGNLPGLYPPGNYTATLSYGGEVLSTTHFQVVEGSDLKIPKQQLKISEFIDDISWKSVETPEICGSYCIVIPIKLGDAPKDSVFEAYYKIRSSNQETNESSPLIWPENYYVLISDSNSNYEMTLKYFGLNDNQKADLINGENIFIDIYINGQFFSTIKYEPVTPDVSYELVDAFAFASPYNDYHTMTYYDTQYSSFKQKENQIIDISDNNSLYASFYVNADIYNDHAILIDYVRVELVNDETGKVVYTLTENYKYINDKTGMRTLMLFDNLKEDVAPGDYTLSVYTEKDGSAQISTKYTFVE